MSLPLTEADFALFEPVAAVGGSTAPAVRTRPAKGRPSASPVRELKPLRRESKQSQNEKALKAWKQSLTAYAVCGVVALGLFMVVQSGAGYHQALMEQRQLMVTLEQAQQRNIGCQTLIERRFSLERIQKHAKEQLHMIPVEDGRVHYINVSRGDERLD